MSKTSTMNHTKGSIAAVVALLLGGCGGSDAAPSDPSAASGDLPVVHRHVDEAGPDDVKGAWTASDYVVLATIAGSTDGARFYGGGGAEDISGAPSWTEAVELHLEVLDYLKGSGGERLDIRWPTYVTSQPSSDTRTGVLEIAGVRRDLSRDGKYVFFLDDQGEPWGLTGTSLSTSLMEIGPDMTLDGQASTVFSGLLGEKLVDVLPQEAQFGGR